MKNKEAKIPNGIEMSNQSEFIEYATFVPNQKKRLNLTRLDCIFALIFFIVGFFFVEWVLFGSNGAGVTAFMVVFALSAGIYSYVSGYRQTKQTLVYLGIVGISALSFSYFDTKLLKYLMMIYLSSMSIYWICVGAERQIPTVDYMDIMGGRKMHKKEISSLFFWDLYNLGIRTPFANFRNAFSGMVQLFGKKHGTRINLGVVLGMVICIPILIIVINLLASADFAFEQLVASVKDVFGSKIFDYKFSFLLAIPAGCYFYALLSGSLKGWHTDGVTADGILRLKNSFRLLPCVTIYMVLTALIAVYILYFISQSAYLFSAFRDALPEALTYAEYARRGFSQLCIIAGINFTVITLSHLLMRPQEVEELKGQQDRGLKVETVMLSALTLLLIVTALSKMAMYITYYGLTRLRVYTSWFMILLLLMFILVIARTLYRFNGAKVAFVVFTVSFLSLCYGNVDGLIAKNNVERFMSGSLDSFFPEEYSGQAAAIPYLARLYDVLPMDEATDDSYNVGLRALSSNEITEMREDLYCVITKQNSSGEKRLWYDGDFRGYNAAIAKAQAIANEIK